MYFLSRSARPPRGALSKSRYRSMWGHGVLGQGCRLENAAMEGLIVAHPWIPEATSRRVTLLTPKRARVRGVRPRYWYAGMRGRRTHNQRKGSE